MSDIAYLVLENGIVFQGRYFGAQGDITGEVVFNTGMVGYVETLTDQSYHGQIVLQTFPLIGNYGVTSADFESDGIGPLAYIVKYPCQTPSNFRSEGTLDDFLRSHGIIGLCGIDTRAVTQIIRTNGVMNGKIMATKPTEADFHALKLHKTKNHVFNVSTKEIKYYKSDTPKYTVALYDFGAKHNIWRELNSRGCDVVMFPCTATADEILAISPDGIMLSNGPGDPQDNASIIENIKTLLKSGIPMFGICLGHQLLALANGFTTTKLKFGHRGANQPVKDIQSGKVYITSQNHGYTVQSESIDSSIADLWFQNVNDKTCEGIIYKNAPAFTAQFHPEAHEGPQDTRFLFDKFVSAMEAEKHE